MHYIKWNGARTAYDIWNGPSLGMTAMTAKGYERVETLPAVIAEPPPLESLIFSKYKVARKLMELGLWENVKSGLTEAQKDFLYLSQDFSLPDENFTTIYNRLKTQIPDIDSMLRECVLT